MKNYVPKGPFDKICKMCDLPFKGVFNQIYCSRSCSKLAHSQKYPPAYGELSTGKVGALNELRVCVDLLNRGYDVFRAVSPSCPCDLIILKSGIMKRIEVRTARRMVNGTISFPMKDEDSNKSDHYAAALENEIIYFPPLDEKSLSSSYVAPGRNWYETQKISNSKLEISQTERGK